MRADRLRDEQPAYSPHEAWYTIDVKTFLRFFLNFGHVFTFLTFFVFQPFFYFKKNVGKVQKQKHFQNNNNEIDL